MKKLFLLITFIFIFAFASYGQTDDPKVEISQETADKCADCFVQSKLLKDELAVKNKSIEDLKAEITRLQISLAEKSGENAVLRTDAISIRAAAIIQDLQQKLADKKTKKCNGVNLFC